MSDSITITTICGEIREGDPITVAGHFKKYPWWMFWKWFAKKELQVYIAGKCITSGDETVVELK